MQPFLRIFQLRARLAQNLSPPVASVHLTNCMQSSLQSAICGKINGRNTKSFFNEKTVTTFTVLKRGLEMSTFPRWNEFNKHLHHVQKERIPYIFHIPSLCIDLNNWSKVTGLENNAGINHTLWLRINIKFWINNKKHVQAVIELTLPLRMRDSLSVSLSFIFIAHLMETSTCRNAWLKLPVRW